MSDELLDYYNRELAYFRKMAQGFAERHPKIAGRLRLGERVEDPHVSRLIEAFAYLNARVRLKVEDEFPELCEGLLSVLYPEYLCPFPSCAVVQFKLQPAQFGLAGGHQVERGLPLVTPDIDGEPCRFETCYPVSVLPMDLVQGEVSTPPFAVPQNTLAQRAKAVVRLELKTFKSSVTFQQIALDRLRVFLNGDSRYVYDLHELILNNATGVVVAQSDRDNQPLVLPPSVIQPVGFEPEESLINYAPQSRLGYHLLTEFFCFPQKFLFFDIEGLEAVRSHAAGQTDSLCLYIFLDRVHRNLESLPSETFQIGATPAINLFETRCEPVRVSAHQSEFRLVPDARRPLGNEVYSVGQVVAAGPERQQMELLPFYSTSHGGDRENGFWFARRRPSQIRADQFNAAEDLGTELYLSLVSADAQNQAQRFDNWTLDVRATCFNRDYPHRLPLRTVMTPRSGASLLQQATCLVHPTETIRPQLKDQAYWRLISHLSLNHLSLLESPNPAESLREILRLYNLPDSRSGNLMLEGLVDVQARRIVSRIGGGLSAGFGKGTGIELTLDEEKFSGGGHYLFAAVLDRFLGLYSTINSFTRTVVRTRQQEGELCAWPPRTGERRNV